MSLLDRLPGRLRRYALLADAVSRLGPGWTWFRVRYWLGRRLGFQVRRSPVGEWPALVPDARVPEVVDIDALSAWLREHCDEERLRRLRKHAGDVAAGRFEVFGQMTEPDDWHHDARDGHRYNAEPHWSRVATPVGADIKFVWEPSRFGWIFDLVRLHLIDPGGGADAIFWNVLDEWCEQNPPNRGVNWSCGQEASIRLMAVVIAASGMRSTATHEQIQKLQRLAWVTAARVEANIDYARSQKNNHHASEAVGLLTAALLFPGHPRTDVWRSLAEFHLEEVCSTLVFADGGTSQYSTNYHRVFVHNFLWATQILESTGHSVPIWLEDATERAGRVLQVLVEPQSGSGPFFGHDDGARLLPLTETPHRNLEEDGWLVEATLASQSVAVDRESGSWFVRRPKGRTDSDFARMLEDRTAGYHSLPDFGVHVLRLGACRAYLRAGAYRFRPSQDDLLHLDLWANGVNLLPDSGTASYHGATEVGGMMSAAAFHNGPRRPSVAALESAGKFLWARWSPGEAGVIRAEPDRVVGEFLLHDSMGTIRREVTLEVGSVQVVDSCEPAGTLLVSWAANSLTVAPGNWDFERRPLRTIQSFVSKAYGSADPCERWVESGGSPLQTVVRRAPVRSF